MRHLHGTQFLVERMQTLALVRGKRPAPGPLGEIDRRVRYLSKRLEALRVVGEAPSDREAVFFGATIEVENLVSGDTQRYRIVGVPYQPEAAGEPH